MAESEITIAAYREAVAIFESLPAPIPETAKTLREKQFPDGTRVFMQRYRGYDHLDPNGAELDHLYATVRRAEGHPTFGFRLNQNGLVAVTLHPLSIKIAEAATFIFNDTIEVGWSGSKLPRDSVQVFREASKPLVGWLKTIVLEEQYLIPPFVISS